MIERTSSPEERLLRLIRVQPAEPRPAAPPATARPSRHRAWPRLPLSATLRVLNGLLLMLLAGFIVAGLWALMRPATVPVSAAPAAPVAVPPPPAEPPALEAQVFQRPLFQSAATTSAGAAPDAAANRQQAQAAVATLSLIGIMDGQPPQAIVADAQTQKTYFLKEGETFGDGLLLEKIEGGRVLLRAHGVQLELRL